MGSLSLWHWLVVGIVVVLLFGRGRSPRFMTDLADGIKNFRREARSIKSDAEIEGLDKRR